MQTHKFYEAQVPIFAQTAVIWRSNNIQLIIIMFYLQHCLTNFLLLLTSK